MGGAGLQRGTVTQGGAGKGGETEGKGEVKTGEGVDKGVEEELKWKKERKKVKNLEEK